MSLFIRPRQIKSKGNKPNVEASRGFHKKTAPPIMETAHPILFTADDMLQLMGPMAKLRSGSLNYADSASRTLIKGSVETDFL